MSGTSAPDLARVPSDVATDLLLSADQAAGGGFDYMGLILMVVAMGAIMYFLVYRPQQREKSAREALLGSLAKGDEIVTSGGLHGTIVSVEADVVRIDIGGKSAVTVDKSAVARKAGQPAPTDKK
jgi:preprotein translocase subunit YajC